MKFDDYVISFKTVAARGRKTNEGLAGEAEAGKNAIQFNAITHHSRIPVIGGFFSSQALEEPFDAQKALKLQHEYRAALDLAHSWTEIGMPGTPPATVRSLSLGQEIARTLPPNMRVSIVKAAVQARQRRRVLRIILDFYPEATVLLGVPWELMVLSIHDEHEPGSQDFLLLDPWITIVRQVRNVGVVCPTTFPAPLALEACAAQPHGVDAIDIDAIRAAFESRPGWDQSRWHAANATVETLYKRLTNGQPAILHLICHGGKSNTPEGDRYDLLLTHAKGGIRRAGAAELGPILTASPDLRLIVLHACYGGVQEQSPEEQRAAIEGVATGLLRRGIPLIIAFQGEVSQEAAVVFTGSLYAGLEAGLPLEYAVTRARVAVHACVPQALLDWSLPVVYRGSEELDVGRRIRTMADRVEVGVSGRPFHRIARSGFISLSLALFVLALLHAFILPPSSITQVADAFNTFLCIMTLLGIVVPALVAVTYRSTYQTRQLASRAKKQVILTQWAGAYLGYGLGYMNALLFYVVAFLILGRIVATFAFQVGMTSLLAGLAVLYSHIGMRMQVRGAWALAEESPNLFNNGLVVLLLGVSAAFILGVPAFAHYVLVPSGSFLLQAMPLSFVLGTALIALVLGLSE